MYYQFAKNIIMYILKIKLLALIILSFKAQFLNAILFYIIMLYSYVIIYFYIIYNFYIGKLINFLILSELMINLCMKDLYSYLDKGSIYLLLLF